MILQNVDINVGPGHYKDMAPDELLITSIWYTIQGEGPLAGRPAVFIRLAGCNRGEKQSMGCGFCDTNFFFVQGRRLRISEIKMTALAETVKNSGIANPLPLVVITGGEPMMQGNLRRLIPHLLDYGFPHVQIESNGDRLIPELAEPNENITLVVSPKVSREGYRPLNEKVRQRLNALKFVVNGDPASPYYDVPHWADFFPQRKVYVSPLAEYREGVRAGQVADAWNHRLIDIALTKRNYQRAARIAMDRGFSVSIQQHLFLGMP